jgi:glycosyltransferase involved in cell wall biosynthesis
MSFAINVVPKQVKPAAADMPPLRIALVHDWLTGMRGGEKVLEQLCKLCPDAPLWTLICLPGKVSKTIAARSIHTSLLQHMPFAAKKYRSYLPLFPVFAELNRPSDVDLVISTSHAVAKSMVKRRGPNKPYHICYIHTPMRYAWDLFDEYFGPERVGWFASRFFFAPLVQMLRLYDAGTVGRVDLFLANSTYVAERVRRVYGREAEVVPPPVDTERFKTALREPEDWYLIVSALVPYKRVDHAIRSCHRMGVPLKVVGIGPELDDLKKLAAKLNSNVEFVGFASDEALVDYYRRAKALLFPGVEDFGIVPVEAIACGCPVIALALGGILDSMTEETAIFYDDPTVEGLMRAMERFEECSDTFSETTLRKRAAFFSEANFLERFEVTLQCVQRHLSAGVQEISSPSNSPAIAGGTPQSSNPAA